ncbi:MAG: TetR/AcrR family transcriptional regulator [Chlorobi bacterium]|nr:TetR/AcrR family transcriptional regulator [Chlorobiota bacterium]
MLRKSTDIRQEEIKRAVLTIIHRDGLKNISTKNLAKEVGISEGTIFRHFQSKNDIMMGIIDDVSQGLIEELKKITLLDKPADKRLFDLLCKTVTYLVENKGITILLFSEASYDNDTVMLKKLNYIFNSQKQLAGKIISDGIAAGIWDKTISIEDVTTLYMGIPITLNIEMILNGEKFQYKNFCNRMYNLMLKILMKT